MIPPAKYNIKLELSKETEETLVNSVSDLARALIRIARSIETLSDTIKHKAP